MSHHDRWILTETFVGCSIGEQDMSVRDKKPTSSCWLPLTIFGLSTSLMLTCTAAALDEHLKMIELPDSIYMTLSDDPSLDRDNDGLKDDYENRLADAWQPYFIFDENENIRGHCSPVVSTLKYVDAVCCSLASGLGCLHPSVKGACTFTKEIVKTLCKGNVDDDSLQPFEPVVIFQVRPMAGSDWPRRTKIRYVSLYRLDGGYRVSNICTSWHYGDNNTFSVELTSYDGVSWTLDKLDWDGNVQDASSSEIEWTEPRDTYWGQMPKRPSPIAYNSAGKHHMYISVQACQKERQGPIGICGYDACRGGVEVLANLTPNGTFNNVGEYQAHPSDMGVNVPFVSDLEPLGYPGELVWEAKYACHCSLAATAATCFTGGTGENWKASNEPPQDCIEPSTVYERLDLTTPPVLPIDLGPSLLFTLF
jgi:hypothetical protein